MSNNTIIGMRAAELKELFKNTVEDINAIEKVIQSIEDSKSITSDAAAQITSLHNEAKEKIITLRDVYLELIGTDGQPGLKEELDELLEEFKSVKLEIQSAQKVLEGYSENLENGEEKHIEGLIEKTQSFFESQKEKFTQIYDRIETELLPGATTVSLSKAYKDKVDTYKMPNKFWLSSFFITIGIILGILWLSLLDIKKILLRADAS